MPKETDECHLTASLSFDETTLQSFDSGKTIPHVNLLLNNGEPMVADNSYGEKIILDLSTAFFEKDKTPIIWQHDPEKRLGYTTKQTIESSKITASGLLACDNELVRSIVSDAKNGFPFQSSLGARYKPEFLDKGKTATINGKQFQGPLVVAREAKIFEVTMTTLGADRNSSATIKANLKQSSQPNNQTTKGDTMSEDIKTQNEKLASNLERTKKLENIFLKYKDVKSLKYEDREFTLDEFHTEAIRSNLEPAQAELPLVLATLQAPPNTINRPTRAKHHEIVGAYFFSKLGKETLGEQTLGAQAMEEANQYKTYHPLEICRLALKWEGIPEPSTRDEMLKLSFSTDTMQYALAGNIDKLAWEGYMDSPSTWRSVARVIPISNFRTHSRIRVHQRGSLLEIGPHGTPKHGWLSDEKTDIRLRTFAKMVGLSRDQIYNDDLSALQETPAILGRQAARAVSDLFWETVMENGSNFFHDDHANLMDAPLGISGLTEAVYRMMKQTDEDGNNLDIRAATLVVPPELHLIALQLRNSIEVSRANTNEPTGNALKDIVNVEVEPRLSNSTKYPNLASSSRWYLFSKPVNSPVLVGFLDGREAPIIQQFGLDNDPHLLSITFRVVQDVGCALSEYRAAIMSTGDGSN